MKMGWFKHFYYTFLFLLFLLVIVYCTGALINTLNNFADAINYSTDGHLRVIFTDYDGD